MRVRCLSDDPVTGFLHQTRRWRISLFLIALTCLAFESGCSAQDIWATYRQQVETRVAQFEATRPPGQLVSGVYMFDLRTGEGFVEIRSGQMLITASNMKLFTSAFALEKLGAGFSFTTKVYLDGNDIVVVGDGDPTIGAPDLAAAAGESVYAELDRWADAIKTQAAGQFTGNLVLASCFNLQGQFHHPNKSNTTNPAWWSAPVDALNYHDNFYDVTFTVSGGSVTPHVEPASSFIQVINNLQVGPTNWSLSSAPNESTVTLNGRVASSTSNPRSISGNHPGMLLGRTLADRIIQAGVSFTGQIQTVDCNSLNLTGAVLLYEKSLPLSESMKRMNKRSLNMAANCHFLRAGDGTWAGSQTLITQSLIQDYNLDPNGFNVIEGSGLFESCRVQPLVFVDLLTQMTTHPDGNILIESLPISGLDGTLEEQNRYQESNYLGRVLGKTGTVGSASCLTGYVLDAPFGEPVIVFSILNNRTDWWSGSTWRDNARDMQDDVIKLLVDTLDAQGPSPTITAWYSAATHGRGVGEALLEISDDGNFSESRSSGVNTLVVTFDQAIDPASLIAQNVEIAGRDANSAVIDPNSIAIGTSTRNGDTEAVITFTPALGDYARYLVQISGVTNTSGAPLAGDADRIVTALVGDTSGDLRVNATDLSLVRGARTKLIDANDAAQVRADVSYDGRINASDRSRVRARRDNDARGISDPTIP